jgi:hypothetical protein
MGIVETRCFQWKIERKVIGRLSSGVISYIQLGDGCVVEMRGLLLSVCCLHGPNVGIILEGLKYE